MGVVLVTGASSGIGASCAAELARAGHIVYGTSRTAPPLDELATPVGGAPPTSGTALLLRMEITDDESVRSGVASILRQHGRIDALINNAGAGLAGAAEDTTLAEAQAHMDTNFWGAVRLCNAVLPHMRAQRAGTIVNMSSMAGLVGVPFQPFYTASKFALEGYSAALRAEVHAHRIRVVVIRPGDFNTGFTSNRKRVAAWAGSPYQTESERALALMEREEQGGPSPDRIAALVTRIVDGDATDAAYTVGNAGQRALMILRRVLSDKQIDGAMRMYYKL